ncbi:MAG: hypothetical protein CME17_01080 [Gemmatimonadetes bacterium]|nr:hypothetical protein [Gemmatimonadota bacterium]
MATEVLLGRAEEGPPPEPPTIQKAAVASEADGTMPGPPAHSPEALTWDPYSLVEQLGYRQKPSAITYQTLERMFWQLPILGAIRKTRTDQVASFCQSQRPAHEPGFRIRLREMHREPDEIEKQRMLELEDLITHTGYTTDPRSRDSFETLVRKLMHDSLTYDQMNLEIVPDARGIPSTWYAVDASTIRLADTTSLHADTSMDNVYAVQVYDDIVINEFTRRDLTFTIRNPRTSIRSYGYGTSEAEMMVSTITYLLWGLQYNGNQFSQGNVSKGLLNIKGSIPEKQLRAFRRQWYQMVNGVENAFRTPIINAEDVEWINMHASNREMEYSQWLDFLIKVACAVYSIDPIEINFKYGSGGGQKNMFDSANKTKIVESKTKGLAPLLRYVENMMNENIVWCIDPRFTFEFTGLSPMTAKEQADLETMKVRTYMTVDEIRAMHDLPALPDELGKVINDPNWMQGRRDFLLRQQIEEGDPTAVKEERIIREDEESEKDLFRPKKSPTKKSYKATPRRAPQTQTLKKSKEAVILDMTL